MSRGKMPSIRSTSRYGIPIFLALVVAFGGASAAAGSSSRLSLEAPVVLTPPLHAPGVYVFRFALATGVRHLRYARFRCALDALRWKYCPTPYRIRLAAGAHRLRVQGLVKS